MLRKSFYRGILEAGCDEAGRGCLAGPVFAAAVIFPEGFSCPHLNDSKKLSPTEREVLRSRIESDAAAWAVARATEAEIDRLNILRASILAMHRALDGLGMLPALLLIDGNQFTPYRDIPYRCIVKGDAKFQSIAAASILAKTHRDEHMVRLHGEFPEYQWKHNKGYPTAFHRQVIARMGITPHHRKSFRWKSQLFNTSISSTS